MQFSYNWLKTWLDIDLSPAALADKLTMSGLEVEEVNLAAPEFSGVVVAEIKSIEKHPDADRLNITQVDVGKGELLQIVCGAPNVKVGIKVPCALSGAKLPGDFNIKPTKMRGQVSNGMLCSSKELGLPDEGVDGLLVLAEDAVLGQDIRDCLDLDDAILTLKITPNRADCLSIKGIARELSALVQNSNVKKLQSTDINENIDDIQVVEIKAVEDCGRFLTRRIHHVNSQISTPKWIKQRLYRSGVRPVSVLVDIGNYVMLELGQPMHIFDADKVSDSMVVRRANNGEILNGLNGKKLTLSDDTLVVADRNNVLSIAGILGGEETAVSESTKNIIIEAAWFKPETISGKSRKYGFSTDSSFRFERGVDFNLQKEAIIRVTELIVEICKGEVGPITESLGQLPNNEKISVRLNRVKKVLGLDIDKQYIELVLTQLGFGPKETNDGFEILSPSFRFDIKQEIDLIEEIGRVYGYENIPSKIAVGSLAMKPLPENCYTKFDVLKALSNRGYQEVISYAFVDEQWEHDLSGNHEPIVIKNPLAAQYAVMRSTLLGSLLEILRNNLNRKQDRVKIFEVARTFIKNGNSKFIQKENIAGLNFGTVLPEQWGEQDRIPDFYDVKSDIEFLLKDKNLEFTKANHPALHPGRMAEIKVNDISIGFIGELHPKWIQKYELPYAPIYFEIDFEAVLEKNKVTYKPTSKFQPVRRDLAFLVPDSITYQQVLDALHSVNDQIIQELSIFDVYRGQGVPEGMSSIAIKIIFNDIESTLTDERVQKVVDSLLLAANKINIKLRS